MRLSLVLKRWIEILAALLVSWREAWRARRPLIVSRDAEGFRIQQGGPAGEQTLCTTPAGRPVPKEVTQVARRGLVVLELPRDTIMTRRISVPVKARDFVPGIIRNQIDRLSPWEADDAAYGFDTEASPDDPTALDVQVFITSRATVDAARAESAAIGLTVDRIIVRECGRKAGAQVVLWSRVADAPRETGHRIHRAIGFALAGCVAVSFAVTALAITSAASIRERSEEVEARIKTLQRQLHATGDLTANESSDPAERAWFAKQSASSTVVSLEALSRALPDTAYLTDLQFERGTVRMIGFAADVPSLVAPLEQSGHFTAVHFFAPTTRGSDATLYRFHIEAQVKAGLTLGEN